VLGGLIGLLGGPAVAAVGAAGGRWRAAGATPSTSIVAEIEED
jgi:hypothetical protein